MAKNNVYPSYSHQKNSSKLRHTQQKQIIHNLQPQQLPVYYYLKKGSSTPPSKPELVHFSLEPRRRRSKALTRDIFCTHTRTQLVTTEDKGRRHLVAKSCTDTSLKKAWKEAWATPSTVMMRGQQKVAHHSSAATTSYLLIFSRAWLLRTLLEEMPREAQPGLPACTMRVLKRQSRLRIHTHLLVAKSDNGSYCDNIIITQQYY